VQDAPLPSLGAYTFTSHHQPQHGDDDFGDFDDALNNSMATEVREEAGGKSERTSVDVTNDCGSFASRAANALVQPELAAEVGSDNDDLLSSAFNALAPSHDSTLHLCLLLKMACLLRVRVRHGHCVYMDLNPFSPFDSFSLGSHFSMPWMLTKIWMNHPLQL
jgi:hypothetical protein